MKLSIATICAAFVLAQSTSAWLFTWRGSNGQAQIVDGGDSNKKCTGISHKAGKDLEWDRGFWSDCCVSVYTNKDCSGDPQGYSCDDWTKTASVNLDSFKVTNC